MGIRLTDHGLKFDSSGRLVGRYTAPGVGAFVLGSMWGCVREDGTGVLFLRPASELSEAERAELAEYQIGMWNRFREP